MPHHSAQTSLGAMPPVSWLRRSLLPLAVIVIVLVGQPVATLLVIAEGAHHPERWTVLASFLYILWLPSTVLELCVRAVTERSTVELFGAYAAHMYLGFGLNAFGWALLAGVVCVAIQRRLTRRCS